MAHAAFTLHIVTVAEALFEGAAAELHCTGTAGQLTVLAHHEPLITRLETCTVRVVTPSGETEEFPINGGVLEVADNKAVVLCSGSE